MAGQGDMNLARELQAQFSRAKPRRRNGRGKKSEDFDPQPPRQFSHARNNSHLNRGRGEPAPIHPPPRLVRPGPRTASNSSSVSLCAPDIDAFFHQPRSPVPSRQPTTASIPTNLTSTTQQHHTQQPMPQSVLSYPAAGTGNTLDVFTFRISKNETKNQASLEAAFIAPSSATKTAFNENKRKFETTGIEPGHPIGSRGDYPFRTLKSQPGHEGTRYASSSILIPIAQHKAPQSEQTEAPDDVEMGGVDYPLSTATNVASKPAPATSGCFRLADSIWNPANQEKASLNHGSDASRMDSSSTKGRDMSANAPTKITSGLIQGYGLGISR
ncbi:hypothetical protein F5Y19DRAFT_487404 [Xylariaceae sp. FL1651]|nr:hypothetical protein F5Y19DRAFT_487404 [Xylariaceae sp. FL1651]